jgi:shikimate kinase
LKARGVVIALGKTMTDLWRERHPLYVKYAHLGVTCNGDDTNATVAKVIENLEVHQH